MSENEKTITIVIPVRNNEQSLRELHQKLASAQQGFSGSNIKLACVYVDDYSEDNSRKILSELLTSNITTSVILFSRQQGQMLAVIEGLKKYNSDGYVIMSADLQDPPELIPNLIKNWNNGYEMVFPYRENRNDGLLKKATATIAYGVLKLRGFDFPSGGFDWGLISKKARDFLVSRESDNRFIQAELVSLGLPIMYVPYVRPKRPYGKSQHSLLSRWKLFWAALTYKPEKQ